MSEEGLVLACSGLVADWTRQLIIGIYCEEHVLQLTIERPKSIQNNLFLVSKTRQLITGIDCEDHMFQLTIERPTKKKHKRI
jgi:hypothetical protein